MIGRTLDNGRYEIVKYVDSHRRYKARDRREPSGRPLLVFLTGRHGSSYQELERWLAFPFPKIAPLRAITELDPGPGVCFDPDALLEEEPEGRRLSEIIEVGVALCARDAVAL